MAPIKFYDLVTAEDGAYWSPNTWKIRLALVHKKVDFVSVDVTLTQLRGLATKWGVKRALVPTVELEDGTVISDSWKIAEWLEKTFPDAPSLFLPSSATAVSFTSPEMQVARNFALLFNTGFGDSDPGWSTMFEVCAPILAECFTDPAERAYYTSDEKLGIKDGWAKITGGDQALTYERAVLSLLPLEAVLRSTPFLAGDAPGLVDYIAYGRWAMVLVVSPVLASRIWLDRETPLLKDWIARVEGRYRAELGNALERMPKIMTL